MTLAARIAYINSQTAAMLAEIEGMKAFNLIRQRADLQLAYGDEAFMELPAKYGLTHNQVIDYLREP